jgi:condensin complex subunit 1
VQCRYVNVDLKLFICSFYHSDLLNVFIIVQVLTLVLENNPFTDSLSPSPYKRKMMEMRQFILENMPADFKESMEESIHAIDEGNETEKVEIENAAINATIAEHNTKASSQSFESHEAYFELTKKLKIFQFLKSALDFINTFENANASFQSMLLSSNKSDVTEALRFFVRARHFQLPCAVTGIKQALSLMWSDEKSVQDEVMTAFVDVFICGTNGSVKLPSKQIVDNLIRLVGKANASELTSIEEAISRLVKEEIIPSEVFLILWSIAAKAPGKPRSVAMTILSMGATSDSGIVDSASRLRHLLQAGLGEYTEEHRDWATAKSAAYALQRVSRVRPNLSSAKFLVLEQIVERLCFVIQGDWCDDAREADTCAWFGAAEEAINAVFAICPAPEQVARLVIIGMQGSTFGFTPVNGEQSCHSLRLSRFFFVIGHIALKLLVYSEALSSAVRNANSARTVAKQEEADRAQVETGGNSGDHDDIEKELGLAQAAEAEAENMMAAIADKEIVGSGLIDLFTPLVIRVVANECGKFSSEIIMQSSVLTLCKLMCISRSFCEKHLPLLFTALANAPKKDITLRANTVIALGDLAFRFPNEVEPYTSKLYSCLRDASTRVRLHTLMVLTHLILNDMVKVKGQVCEIALCLRDQEIRIRDMARLLFHELSKRSNNPIYNLLPEIVSRLSSMSVKKDDFRAIMSFLLNFIKKERQAEMIVEKLCHRFPKCTSISQKANISHCLAHVKINEKCIKILNDHFNLYKDALFDEDVLRNFLSIVTKTKKFAKPELKEALEEWETKLKLQADMGLEDEEANRKAEHTKKRVTRHSEQKEIEEESGNGSESIEEEDDGGDSDDEMEFDQEGDENLVPTTNTPDRNKGRIVPPRKLCQKRDALSSLN